MNPSSVSNLHLELKDKNFQADYYSRHKIIQAMAPEIGFIPLSFLATAGFYTKKIKLTYAQARFPIKSNSVESVILT